MPYRAWFQCIAGCEEKYELNEVVYQCKKCGDLLEVEHDLDRLRRHSPEHWKKVFDERYRRSKWPYGSSVWGKKEWVCPKVDNSNVVSFIRRWKQPLLGRTTREGAWS